MPQLESIGEWTYLVFELVTLLGTNEEPSHGSRSESTCQKHQVDKTLGSGNCSGLVLANLDLL
jgi:hypothetical protein